MESKKDRVYTNKKEAVDFVNNFYRTSYQWRDQSYHAKWDKWERNYRAIYDPDIAALKEAWQAKMFIPSTTTVVEVIDAALTKLLMGRENPIGVKRRELGDELQASHYQNLLENQLQESEFVLNYGKAQKESLIFGSGFMKFYWEKLYEMRNTRIPKRKSFLGSEILGKLIGGQDGFIQGRKETLIRDQVKADFVHIRDIFLEPNSTDMARVLHRGKITYNEMAQMVKDGFDKESVDALYDVQESQNFDDDISVIKAEQDIADSTPPRPKYDKQHTIWEYWGLIPRRWVELDRDPSSNKSEEVVPGKIMVASGEYFLASQENMFYDPKPPFLQMQYIDTGNTYGIGPAGLIEGLQDELNEIRNLRVDNGNLAMNKMFVTVEKYLVDTKELRSAPGAIIRLKSSEIDDVRKVLMELPISDVALSAFKESFEVERQIQEVSGANRVTTGTAGMVRDANQTLGGMELLKQSAADRFVVTGFKIGKQFLTKAAEKYIELITQNMSEEAVKGILGQEPIEMLPGQWMAKWQTFKWLTPEEFKMSYNLIPFDVFTEENLSAKKQDLASYLQLVASLLPRVDLKPGLKRLGLYNKFTEEEIDAMLKEIQDQGAMTTPMGMGMGIPSVARSASKFDMAGSKVGVNSAAPNGATPMGV